MGRTARDMATWGLSSLLAAVTALSCGGADRLSRKEFVAKGNAVCTRSDKKLKAAFEEELAADGRPTAGQMQAVLKRVVPIVEDTVTELKELEPPANLEDSFDAALAEAKEAVASLKKGARSTRAAEAVFSAEEDPFARTNAGLESVGITACSEGGGAGDGDEGAAGGEGSSVIGTGMARVASTFVATEYRFAGASAMKRGRVTIELSNRGREAHEMTVVRLENGVTAQQVMDAEAAGTDVEGLVADDEVGAVGPVEPGATGSAEVALVPGTYAYACFVDSPDGRTHVARGMFGQFTVT